MLDLMKTVELIAHKASILPVELQEEALRYMDYLLNCNTESTEAREWTDFAAAHLATQYSPDDSVYDED